MIFSVNLPSLRSTFVARDERRTGVFAARAVYHCG
jgi:hypothetical protein